jgi:tRNA A37 threonylcarbamoyladenosine modification protein TsaB
MLASIINTKSQTPAGFLAKDAQRLLKSVGVGLADIGEIRVATGPGSFTGIRMGLAFCYGLVLPRPKIRIGGLCSLELIASGLCNSLAKPLAVLLPQTQTHGFLAGQDRGSRKLALALNRYTELPEIGLDLYIPDVRFASEAQEVVGSCSAIGAAETLLLSLQGMLKVDRIAESADLPSPLYMRLSTAEEKRLEDARMGKGI